MIFVYSKLGYLIKNPRLETHNITHINSSLDMKKSNLNSGFTLLELMIVVVIISVIAAIAWPNYTRYVQNSRRSDAMVSLNEISAQQEKFYASCGWYATNLYSVVPGNRACGAAAGDVNANLGLRNPIPPPVGQPAPDYLLTLAAGNINPPAVACPTPSAFGCGFTATANPNGAGTSGRMAGNGSLRTDGTQLRQWNRNNAGTWLLWSQR